MNKLTSKEKMEILENKVNEIREEFFATYKNAKQIPWNEHMTVTSSEKIAIEKDNYADEIQREVQIYNITLENVRLALGYLTQENVPIQRPNDFEVEMFKSPKQVDKIQKKIKKQEQKQKHFELKKERIEGKKLHKQMKSKKFREENKDRKQAKKAIEDWKQEIKMKGSENARDLNEFTKNKNPSRRGRYNKQEVPDKRGKSKYNKGNKFNKVSKLNNGEKINKGGKFSKGGKFNGGIKQKGAFKKGSIKDFSKKQLKNRDRGNKFSKK